MKQFSTKEIFQKLTKKTRKKLSKKFKEQGAHTALAKKRAEEYIKKWGADSPKFRKLIESLKGKLKIGRS